MALTKTEVDAILDALDREFMQPEIWQSDVWEVQANHGETHYVPVDVCPDLRDIDQYIDGTVDTNEHGASSIDATLRRDVWCARLSAPGYMDQTDLCVFDSEEEAREYLAETYGDDIALDDDSDSE